MIEIDSTPLWGEAERIMNGSVSRARARYKVTLLADGEEVPVLMMVSIHTRRDYKLSYGDETMCKLLMGAGTFAHRIYPNRDKLEVIVQRIEITDKNAPDDGESDVQTELYTAVIASTIIGPTEAQGTEALSEEALNLNEIAEIEFQLFNKAVEQLRMITVGGIWRRVTVADAITAILTAEAMKIKIDNQRLLLGVNLIEAHNKKINEHIVLPHGLKVFDVPNYIQKRYGVYSTGLGAYIQHQHWWVYPLYDLTRFDKSADVLTVLVLPGHKYAEVERTYEKNGEALTILATGETGFQDDNGSRHLTVGNGVRFADSAKIADTPVAVAGNKARVSRTDNAGEFITHPRPNGVNNVPFLQERVTSNPYDAMTQLTARNGGVFKQVWENSDPSLIIPGMMARVVYYHEGEIWQLRAICLGAEHITHNVGHIGDSKHVTHSVLYFYADNPQPVSEQ